MPTTLSNSSRRHRTHPCSSSKPPPTPLLRKTFESLVNPPRSPSRTSKPISPNQAISPRKNAVLLKILIACLPSLQTQREMSITPVALCTQVVRYPTTDPPFSSLTCLQKKNANLERNHFHMVMTQPSVLATVKSHECRISSG
ncbi:hypothetical protein IE81DRAFT_76561 [Ceraceosorus guamensis]|uniref:Uncharacterized protein n=1 Tax=Ceraceosorus guamensis TaxID=1522189 RepID=A0A316W1E2_9BASI|nr:hypothetical protein IE81DRAFT_76561 [Ceraceosorus guamensis]PWN43499.1 hypothetical protein IE81DRAFT_76561 [Ceraceosorus guamensis]